MSQCSRETQRLNNAEWYKANAQRVKQNRIERMRKAALEELEIAAAAGMDIVAMVKGGAADEQAKHKEKDCSA